MPPVVAGVALAAGAFVAGGATLAGLAAASLLTQSIFQIGVGLALSGIAQEFMPKPSLGSRARTSTIREPVSPRSLIYGRVRTGGVLVFIHTNGKKDKYLHMVIAIATHSVQKIGAVYFNGEEAIDENGTPIAKLSSNVLIEKNLGTTNQAAFPQLISALPDKWTAAHRGRGIASVHLRLKFDTDLFPNGIPEVTFDIEGKNDIYDPRTMTTGYSENAALCLADYMSLTRFSIGAGIGDEDGINEAELIAAANICDEIVPLAAAASATIRDESSNDILDESGNALQSTAAAAGSTEPRYTCNGAISLEQSPRNVIQAMLTAMAGKAVWRGTDWHIQAGAYRTPSVTLTDRDVREAGLTLETRVTRSENYNGVRGQFVSPENDWQADDFPAYQSATYVAEDGEEVWADIALPFTISSATAQRLAKIQLETQRRQQSAKFSGQLRAYRAVTGETVNFDRARWGYVNKPFIVNNVSLGVENDALVADLSLRETSPLVYSWTATEEQIYNAAPRTTLPTPFDLDPPGVPSITEELYVTRENAVKSRLNLTWVEADSAYVVDYRVQARRTEDKDGNATGDSFVTVSTTSDLNAQINDVAPGLWEVRVRAINSAGVNSAFSTASKQVSGLLAPPNALTNLRIQKAGGRAELSWDQSVDLDVRVGGSIVIRHSESGTPNWANSVSFRTVDGAMAIASVPLKPGTYLVRPQDSSGIYGPVTSISTKGIQAVGFTQVGILTAEPTWSGTKTNAQVNGSALELISTSSPGTYEFAAGLDLTTVKARRVRSTIDVAAVNLGANIDDRTDNIDLWADFDDTEGAEIDVVVEWRYTDDDPAGSPTWSAWERVDSTEEEFRGAEFRAQLSTESPDFNILLSGLTVTADEAA